MAVEGKLELIRHSMAHVMAEAVLQIFPEGKVAIGPAIENGFYYDFDLPRALKPEDLEDISERMRTIIKGKHDFTRKVVSRDEARKMFKGQDFKIELLDAIGPDEEVSVYNQGNFIDLCRGPHVANTKELNPEAFKLLSIAGAYWRGDEKRPMLQRIYGTAWENPKDLRLYLQKLEEIEKRDHRKLGKELDLFSTHEEAGAGLVYWHPMGGRIRQAIEDFWRAEHRKNGYEILYTRTWASRGCGKHRGTWVFYADSMYAPMELDEQNYYIKTHELPLPHHDLQNRAPVLPGASPPLGGARDRLPLRAVRGPARPPAGARLHQDDAHIFCTPEQIEGEIKEVLRFSLHMWKSFGFSDFKATWPPSPRRASETTRAGPRRPTRSSSPSRRRGSTTRWTRGGALLRA
jgi:threonyl-tRNA synthetase